MTDASVSAGFARGLVEFAVSKGADRAALIAAGGLSSADLADNDNRVPFAAYVALMRAAKAATKDDALALHYGEAVDIADVSIVGLIGRASATMMDAFLQLNRYVRLVVDVDLETEPRFQLRHERGGAWVVDMRRDPSAFPELTESAFAQLVCGTRRFGPTPLVLAVHVTHPAPSYAAEYERVLRAPVTFNSDWNALMVDLSWATRPVAVLPGYVFGVLSERGDALLQELAASKTLRGRIEALLLPVLHTGDVGMEAIAEKVAMSRPTLLRKLKEEGTTFESVLDELRYRMAVEYLTGRRASVNETAFLVGFSEAAAFSRAFKRWTGKSPKAFRDATLTP